ncbi:hypothetical protein BCV70DRAFT_156455 [Testicularia cyperi]|uniref:Uncharacterized protein n=1 Tax=Testicularia cyperi TaxID=1882483 RepID=A0A317XUC4_9BASI|nr:hypothetical protein BCV70DRAFT_156455 [Testicularia cyperi]
MQAKVLIVLALCAVNSVMAAHSMYCTVAKDGTGKPHYRATKDCCAATQEKSSTAFDELSHRCEDALGLGNGINEGRFDRCCQGRGDGVYKVG